MSNAVLEIYQSLEIQRISDERNKPSTMFEEKTSSEHAKLPELSQV